MREPLPDRGLATLRGDGVNPNPMKGRPMNDPDNTLSYECRKCGGDRLYLGMTCPRCGGTGYDPGYEEDDE